MIDLAFGLYMAEAEGYDLSTGEKIKEEPEDNINWDEFCNWVVTNLQENGECDYQNHPVWNELTNEQQYRFNYLIELYNYSYRQMYYALVDMMRW